jgi:ribosomal protein S8E
MVQWHYRDDTKPSGGRRNTVRSRTKKLAWKGGSAAMTKTDTTVKENKVETKRGMGNTKKTRALELKYANVSNDKGKIVKAEVIAVKTNDSNRLFARSNISTQGAVIRVMLGGQEKLARITNRPGQEGTVNAKLIE